MSSADKRILLSVSLFKWSLVTFFSFLFLCCLSANFLSFYCAQQTPRFWLLLHYDKLLIIMIIIIQRCLKFSCRATAERFMFGLWFSGCFSSLGNEEGVPSRPFSVSASSQLDGSHTPGDSSLYGSSSWCSSVVASSAQYLQFDFGKVVTVSGIATQGDAVDNKWVTEYTVSYGYDEQSWLDYAGGQVKCDIKEKKTYW